MFKKIGFTSSRKEENAYTLEFLEDEELNAFMLGVIDGDGNVSTEKPSIRVYGLLTELFESIRSEYIKRFGIKLNVNQRFRAGRRPLSVLSAHTRNATMLANLLPVGLFRYYKHDRLESLKKKKYANTVNNKLTIEQREKIVELYKSGCSISEISKLFECDHKTVRYWLSKMDLVV